MVNQILPCGSARIHLTLLLVSRFFLSMLSNLDVFLSFMQKMPCRLPIYILSLWANTHSAKLMFGQMRLKWFSPFIKTNRPVLVAAYTLPLSLIDMR